ncbi:hypothetical protein FACS1894125_1670 [Actinomycetota bacterium]|nr:hypothetical protein FACS1894125_1670 [Actinomycetota bacterium]
MPNLNLRRNGSPGQDLRMTGGLSGVTRRVFLTLVTLLFLAFSALGAVSYSHAQDDGGSITPLAAADDSLTFELRKHLRGEADPANSVAAGGYDANWYSLEGVDFTQGTAHTGDNVVTVLVSMPAGLDLVPGAAIAGYGATWTINANPNQGGVLPSTGAFTYKLTGNNNAAAVQAALAGMRFKINGSQSADGDVVGQVEVELQYEDMRYWVEKTDKGEFKHYYQVLPNTGSYANSYNVARQKSLNGLRGYLSSFTNDDEYNALKSILPAADGWTSLTMIYYHSNYPAIEGNVLAGHKFGTGRNNDFSDYVPIVEGLGLNGLVYNSATGANEPWRNQDFYSSACHTSVGTCNSAKKESMNEEWSYVNPADNGAVGVYRTGPAIAMNVKLNAGFDNQNNAVRVLAPSQVSYWWHSSKFCDKSDGTTWANACQRAFPHTAQPTNAANSGNFDERRPMCDVNSGCTVNGSGQSNDNATPGHTAFMSIIEFSEGWGDDTCAATTTGTDNIDYGTQVAGPNGGLKPCNRYVAPKASHIAPMPTHLPVKHQRSGSSLELAADTYAYVSAIESGQFRLDGTNFAQTVQQIDGYTFEYMTVGGIRTDVVNYAPNDASLPDVVFYYKHTQPETAWQNFGVVRSDYTGTNDYYAISGYSSLAGSAGGYGVAREVVVTYPAALTFDATVGLPSGWVVVGPATSAGTVNGVAMSAMTLASSSGSDFHDLATYLSGLRFGITNGSETVGGYNLAGLDIVGQIKIAVNDVVGEAPDPAIPSQQAFPNGTANNIPQPVITRYQSTYNTTAIGSAQTPVAAYDIQAPVRTKGAWGDIITTAAVTPSITHSGRAFEPNTTAPIPELTTRTVNGTTRTVFYNYRPATYTASFNLDGLDSSGASTVPATQNAIIYGGNVPDPGYSSADVTPATTVGSYLAGTQYKFNGWYNATNCGGGAYNFTTSIVDDSKVLFACWVEVGKYDVIYAPGSVGTAPTLNMPATAAYLNGTGVTASSATPAPRTPGYEFANWDPASGTISSADFTFTAQWTAQSNVAITFDEGVASGASGMPSAFNLAWDDVIPATYNLTPTAVGYEFKGWSTDEWDNPDSLSAAVGFGDFVDAGATHFRSATQIYAIWKVKIIDVNFDLNGRALSAGVAPANVTVGNNGTIGAGNQPSEPIVEGYHLLGWQTDVDCADPTYWNFATDLVLDDVEGVGGATATDNKMTLYACWETKTVSVNFDMAGKAVFEGVAPATRTVPYNATTASVGGVLNAANAPSVLGYVLCDWITTASVTTETGVCDNATTPYNFNARLTANQTVYSSWTKVSSYAVNWVPNLPAAASSDSVVSGWPTQSSVNHASKIAAPSAVPVLSNAGYRFKGWYTTPLGATQYDFTRAQTAGDQTIYAQWALEPTATFNITFDKNFPNGSNLAETLTFPTNLINQALGSVLPRPAGADIPSVANSTGWEFDDWYVDAAGTERFTFEAGNPLWLPTTIYAGWKPLGQFAVPSLSLTSTLGATGGAAKVGVVGDVLTASFSGSWAPNSGIVCAIERSLDGGASWTTLDAAGAADGNTFTAAKCPAGVAGGSGSPSYTVTLADVQNDVGTVHTPAQFRFTAQASLAHYQDNSAVSSTITAQRLANLTIIPTAGYSGGSVVANQYAFGNGALTGELTGGSMPDHDFGLTDGKVISDFGVDSPSGLSAEGTADGDYKKVWQICPAASLDCSLPANWSELSATVSYGTAPSTYTPTAADVTNQAKLRYVVVIHNSLLLQTELEADSYTLHSGVVEVVPGTLTRNTYATGYSNRFILGAGTADITIDKTMMQGYRIPDQLLTLINSDGLPAGALTCTILMADDASGLNSTTYTGEGWDSTRPGVNAGSVSGTIAANSNCGLLGGGASGVNWTSNFYGAGAEEYYVLPSFTFLQDQWPEKYEKLVITANLPGYTQDLLQSNWNKVKNNDTQIGMTVDKFFLSKADLDLIPNSTDPALTAYLTFTPSLSSIGATAFCQVQKRGATDSDYTNIYTPVNCSSGTFVLTKAFFEELGTYADGDGYRLVVSIPDCPTTGCAAGYNGTTFTPPWYTLGKNQYGTVYLMPDNLTYQVDKKSVLELRIPKSTDPGYDKFYGLNSYSGNGSTFACGFYDEVGTAVNSADFIATVTDSTGATPVSGITDICSGFTADEITAGVRYIAVTPGQNLASALTSKQFGFKFTVADANTVSGDYDAKTVSLIKPVGLGVFNTPRFSTSSDFVKSISVVPELPYPWPDSLAVQTPTPGKTTCQWRVADSAAGANARNFTTTEFSGSWVSDGTTAVLGTAEAALGQTACSSTSLTSQIVPGVDLVGKYVALQVTFSGRGYTSFTENLPWAEVPPFAMSVSSWTAPSLKAYVQTDATTTWGAPALSATVGGSATAVSGATVTVNQYYSTVTADNENGEPLLSAAGAGQNSYVGGSGDEWKLTPLGQLVGKYVYADVTISKTGYTSLNLMTPVAAVVTNGDLLSAHSEIPDMGAEAAIDTSTVGGAWGSSTGGPASLEPGVLNTATFTLSKAFVDYVLADNLTVSAQYCLVDALGNCTTDFTTSGVYGAVTLPASAGVATPGCAEFNGSTDCYTWSSTLTPNKAGIGQHLGVKWTVSVRELADAVLTREWDAKVLDVPDMPVLREMVWHADPDPSRNDHLTAHWNEQVAEPANGGLDILTYRVEYKAVADAAGNAITASWAVLCEVPGLISGTPQTECSVETDKFGVAGTPPVLQYGVTYNFRMISTNAQGVSVPSAVRDYHLTNPNYLITYHFGAGSVTAGTVGGNSVPFVSELRERKEEFTLPVKSAVEIVNGKEFVGWNTAADCGNLTMIEGSTSGALFTPTEAVTFYACYSALPVAVIWDGQNADFSWSAPTSQTYLFGAYSQGTDASLATVVNGDRRHGGTGAVPSLPVAPTKVGDTFQYWAAGDVVFDAFGLPSQTFTARWVPKEYTFSLNYHEASTSIMGQIGAVVCSNSECYDVPTLGATSVNFVGLHYGDMVRVKALADSVSGYNLDAFRWLDGTSQPQVDTSGDKVFTIGDYNLSVVASFVALNYMATVVQPDVYDGYGSTGSGSAVAGESGTVSATPNAYNFGNTITLEYQNAPFGWVFDSWEVTATSGGAVLSPSWSSGTASSAVASFVATATNITVRANLVMDRNYRAELAALIAVAGGLHEENFTPESVDVVSAAGFEAQNFLDMVSPYATQYQLAQQLSFLQTALDALVRDHPVLVHSHPSASGGLQNYGEAVRVEIKGDIRDVTGFSFGGVVYSLTADVDGDGQPEYAIVDVAGTGPGAGGIPGAQVGAISKGSAIVNLPAAFADELADGAYTLSVEFTDPGFAQAVTASAALTVARAVEPGDDGDSSTGGDITPLPDVDVPAAGSAGSGAGSLSTTGVNVGWLLLVMLMLLLIARGILKRNTLF